MKLARIRNETPKAMKATRGDDAGVDLVHQLGRLAASAAPRSRRSAPPPAPPRSRCSRPGSAATAASADCWRRTRHSPDKKPDVPSAKLRPLNSDRSTTGFFSVSSQIRKAAKPTAGDDRQDRRSRWRRTSPGPCPGPASPAATRPRPPAAPGPPYRSAACGSGVSRLLRLVQARTVTTRPTGTLIRKIQPQW